MSIHRFVTRRVYGSLMAGVVAAAAACCCVAAWAQPAPMKTMAPMKSEAAMAATPKPKVTPKPPPPPPILNAQVVETGIDAKDFVAVVKPTLRERETVTIVDPHTVAVTATTASMIRVEALAQRLREAAERKQTPVELRVVLLQDHAPETTSAESVAEEGGASARGDSRWREGAALTPEALNEALRRVGVKAADLSDSGLPARVWKQAELAVPVTGGGENRATLTDRFTLLYDLDPVPANDAYEVRISLAERDKSASPFDTGTIGRLLLVNRFRAEVGKPVVVGVTNPARTLVLALVIKVRE